MQRPYGGGRMRAQEEGVFGSTHVEEGASTPVSDSAGGCVLVNSEMHHFQSFDDEKFWTNLKS